MYKKEHLIVDLTLIEHRGQYDPEKLAERALRCRDASSITS